MLKIITLGRRHGEKEFEVILGPDRPRSAHRSVIKEHRRKGSSAIYAEIWTAKPTRKLRLVRRDQIPADRAPVKPSAPPQSTAAKVVEGVKEAAKSVSKVFQLKSEPMSKPGDKAPLFTPPSRKPKPQQPKPNQRSAPRTAPQTAPVTPAAAPTPSVDTNPKTEAASSVSSAPAAESKGAGE